MGKERCAWADSDPFSRIYHDEEWGVPVHDDRKLFEFLVLEGMQAGLSWITILKKRSRFRLAFDNFVPEKIAAYDCRKVEELLLDKGIIRNRMKIEAAVSNARAFLEVRGQYGNIDAFIWQYVGGKPQKNSWKTLQEIPTTSAESEAMSNDLKNRGFKFVGSTICYAYMQAVGMVNDHIVDCFRYHEVS
ncbi:MAG: DNA-3-methyladenine glycosylase I [Candidatus Aminicenantes bacterium]|nr:DNA-3-methyladenine glycosylase I [Candidatus Aminicenantes bacterium]